MREKIVSLGHRVAKSELVSGTFFLFIGTMSSNVLAFVLNLFLVRRLSYVSYAEIAALVSLITLAAIPSQAFLPVIIQFAGKYFAKEQHKEAAAFYQLSNKWIGFIALFIFLLFIVFSPLISDFLHIKNMFEVILSGFIVAMMYIGVTNNAFIQSQLRFQFLSFTTILGGILKLGLSMIFVYAGFQIMGVLWGYFFSFTIPFLIMFLPLRKLFEKVQKSFSVSIKSEILSYGLPTTVAIFSLSSFTSTDILLVKHFFPASSAALYSGLSLVGRIIFYFSAPIASVMFPLVTKRFHRGEKYHNLLYASFLLVLLPSLMLSLTYFLFPKLIISIVLGKRYLAVQPLLGWFGLYLSIFSLLNVAVNFFLSMKKTNVAWFIAIGAILQAIGISLFHGSIAIIVFLSFVISLVLFILLLLYYMRIYGNTEKAK